MKRTLLISMCLLVVTMSAALAEDEPGAPSAVPLQRTPKAPVRANLPKISKETSKPEELIRLAAPTVFRCERTVEIAGRTQFCDSFQAKDAESLRPLFRGVPQALNELDAYQSTRKQLRVMGYVGTTGLAVFFGSMVASRFYKNYEHVDWETQKVSLGDQRLSRTGIAIRNIGGFTGIGMFVGSIVYGYFRLAANETRLQHSVEIYNQSNPDRPIAIQWKTNIFF
ncbi:MAG: hypothetical protein AAB425_03685 [Bdellovibrionota bacterium]